MRKLFGVAALALVALLALLLTPAGTLAAPPHRPGGPPPPHTPPVETVVTVRGTVTDFAYGKRGEVKGLYLDSGIEIKFPPHEAANVQAIIGSGATVEVTGVQHTGPKGDTHVRAQQLTNSATGATMTISSPPPPPGGSPPPPPGGKRPPR